MKITLSLRRRHYVAIVYVFLVMAALIVTGMAGAYHFPQNLKIRTWYDLDAVRNNLGGHHILMNDLDSTTPGYEELTSPIANQGKGWDPIGFQVVTDDDVFSLPIDVTSYIYIGTFDGQGYEIRDLFINRPDEYCVGLFYTLGDEGVIKNIGVVDATVTGKGQVSGLVGINRGTVSNSYSTGNVNSYSSAGGLVGVNLGTVNNSHFTGTVTGTRYVGGLAGSTWGTASNSHSAGTVTGEKWVGGLVGATWHCTVSNSYFSGNVTGYEYVGGLVGKNGHTSTVSNSYSTGSVTGNNRVGGLVGNNYYYGTVSYSYSGSSVTGLGADAGSYLRATPSGIPEPVGYVGGLVGEWLGWTVGFESYSFWDTETSGQSISNGPGTGKTTAEMQDIATFSGAGWDIIAVANPGIRNPSYIWNIATTPMTYPFLSWQS